MLPCVLIHHMDAIHMTVLLLLADDIVRGAVSMSQFQGSGDQLVAHACAHLAKGQFISPRLILYLALMYSRIYLGEKPQSIVCLTIRFVQR